MHKKKIWRVKQPDPALKLILSKELNISPVVAQLLMNRGIYTVEAARVFLFGGLDDTGAPELLKDMDKSVQRVSRALAAGEKILVYGDYDADGITATALLVSFLRRWGGKVSYYIPHRVEEGYGVHLPPLERARETGHSLVITVDCGISARETVEQNNAGGGPDIIVTDHHEPPEFLPPSFAVINPKQQGCSYPFQELAGVGVVFKLCQGLQKAAGESSVPGEELYKLLDLVCVGTVADIVPLRGENRILVKEGLRALSVTENPGLQALMEVCSVHSEDIDTRNISFGLAPRLNAAGRLGDASWAVELLLAENYDEALETAIRLNKENQRRQKTESLVLAEAEDILQNQPGLEEDRVLVLASPNWHPGVIGIVASKLLDKYYRPVLLVSVEGDTATGSARSIPGFNIYRALDYCRDKLIAYGGHEQAAGFTLSTGELEDFRSLINSYADRVMTPETMIPGVELDTVISLDQVNEQLIEQLGELPPHGFGNPYPLLGCHDVSLVNYRGVGKDGAHLKMLVRDQKTSVDGIGFNLGSYAEVLATREVDLAFVPSVNHWNGRRSIQLEVKDLQPSATGLYSAPGDTPGDEGGILSGCKKALYSEPREMFLPAFVNKELAACGVKDGPGNDYCRDGDNHDGNTLNGYMPPEFEDYRNSPNREKVLSELCSKKGSKLVIVNYPYQAIELGCYLTGNKIVDPEDVRVYPGNNKESGNGSVEALKSASCHILIAIPYLSPPGGEIEVDHLVYYSIPFHPADFSGVVNTCSFRRLHWLFNKSDLDKAAPYLDSLAPGREFFAGLYNYLRELSRRNCYRFSGKSAVKTLTKNGFPALYAFSIPVALKVFGELQLLDYKQAEQDNYRFNLYPAPEQKLSLARSATYNYLRQARAACIEWQRYILDTENPFPVDVNIFKSSF